MNHLSSAILNDNFIWDAVMTQIGGICRRGTGDFKHKINCPMCVSRGETPDKTYRCGLIHSADGIGVNCFNCKFGARYSAGNYLGKAMQAFLGAIGVPEREVSMLKYQAAQLAGFRETVLQVQPDFRPPSFDTVTLPPGSQSLGDWDAADCHEQDYLDVLRYLLGRGDVIATASAYYWTPDSNNGLNRKLLIPCQYDDRLVGWIGRCIDPVVKGDPNTRKYYKQIPKNFLFNAKFLNHPDRKYIFVVEGAFDALAIDGVAALSGKLTEHQIRWINQSDKIPVVIPDRDEAGRYLIEIAIRQKWAVATPNYGGRRWWHDNIKDVDEAVRRYGRLFTLQAIIASMTFNPQQIRQRANFSM